MATTAKQNKKEKIYDLDKKVRFVDFATLLSPLDNNKENALLSYLLKKRGLELKINGGDLILDTIDNSTKFQEMSLELYVEWLMNKEEYQMSSSTIKTAKVK